MHGKGGKHSPIQIRLKYGATEVGLTILILTGIAALGVFLLIAGGGYLVRFAVQWIQSGRFPWWGILVAAILAASAYAGYEATRLGRAEPQVRGRLIGVAEAQAGVRKQAEVPAVSHPDHHVWMDGAQVDERLQAVQEVVQQATDLLQSVQAALQQRRPDITVETPPAEPETLELPNPMQLEGQVRQLADPTAVPALEAPGQAQLPIPMGRAGLTKRQWRTLLCDIGERRNTTYARIQEMCGIGHSKAETVREALVQAGICRKGDGERPQLELVEGYEAAIRAEIDRLEGTNSIPFQAKEPEKVPVRADSGTQARQGSVTA